MLSRWCQANSGSSPKQCEENANGENVQCEAITVRECGSADCEIDD